MRCNNIYFCLTVMMVNGMLFAHLIALLEWRLHLHDCVMRAPVALMASVFFSIVILKAE